MAVHAPAPTLAGDLARRRDAARMVRLTRVVAALEDRVLVHAAGGRVPAPLQLALRDFRAELVVLRDRVDAPSG